MRQFTVLSILLISFLLVSCKGEAQKSTTKRTKANKIEVIDFYGTHRCVTCKAIEANAKYTVKHYFGNNPRVIFKTINVDDKSNEKIAERFEAAGTALFLNVIKDGKETHIDLTDFGFSKGRNHDIFTKKLKIKIQNQLKKL